MVSDKDKIRFNMFCQLNTETGCIEWNGTRRTGYGRFFVDGKWWSAHRFSWVIHNDSIPEGQLVLHHCDNKACVNIEHLFLGTQRDNVRDMMKKNRHKPLSGSANPNSKLNELEVKEIRNLYGLGKTSYAKLANKFSVSAKLIELIVKRDVWRSV